MSEEKKEFDLVLVNLSGRQMAMPKAAAFALFEVMQGSEIYGIEHWYKDNKYSNKKIRAMLLTDFELLPTISALNPVAFHTMLLNQQEYEAEQREKE